MSARSVRRIFRDSDLWSPVIEHLAQFKTVYPSIAGWAEKVRAESSGTGRSVFVVIDDDDAIDGLAITRNGARSKLCHFSVSERAQNSGVGLSLMRVAAGEMIGSGARRIHVTTSETATTACGGFFGRFGFMPIANRIGRYRPGVSELEWIVSADDLAAALASDREVAALRPCACESKRPFGVGSLVAICGVCKGATGAQS